MEFILPFQIEPSKEKISYAQKIFFIGSCFSEETGDHFKNLKFDVLQNPNGILYDPRSICAALNSYIENKKYTGNDLFLQDELWHSWQHHSSFSGIDKERVLEKINCSRDEAADFLKTASWLIITPGTAYNYQLKSNNEFVANCHKAPGNSFEKKLMETEEIILKFLDTIRKLRLYNPALKIIFTVSPVRHVRDGIVENNRSKARLIEAIHSIKEAAENVFYFPSYELIIDVLRDYRFYKNDLVHPNKEAVQYVFEMFCNAYIDDDAKKLMTEIKALLNAMHHKPFNKETTAYKQFLKVQLEKTQKLIKTNPYLDLSQEIDYFSS